MKQILPLLSLALLATVVAHAELSIPGYSAYIEPDPNALRVGAPDGVANWSGSNERILWFGEIKNPGKLTASVIVKSVKGGNPALKLSVGNVTHDGTPTQNGDLWTVSFGDFDVPKSGYVRFTLTSSAPPTVTIGAVQALVLDGSAVQGAHFNVEPRRNAASVHLKYPAPGDVDAFYCECTGVEDPVATYYMACGFQRGYLGMQVNSPTERRIIFSVWDSGSGQKAMKRDEVAETDHTTLLAKGDGVVASAFGGEGTGGHSHLVYPWKTGEVQRFAVTSKPAENGSAIYSGYWFHPEKKQWLQLASFKAPKASGTLSGLYSFSENFSGSNGHLRRQALFGNHWVHLRGGDWREITEASFSHDPTGKEARLDRFMGVEQGRFFLSNGGFLEGFTRYGEKFSRPAGGTPPTELKPSELQ